MLCLAGVFTLVQAHGPRDPCADRPGRWHKARSTCLIVIAAALSIDNLAIGFALGTSHVNVVAAALVIGVVSVGLTLAGLELGKRLGSRSSAVGVSVLADSS